MNIILLGAGILGVTSAWYLRQRGHHVTVVDRQAQAALETSYANGGQISVSFCEPWASASAPWKVARWLTQDDAPLLFRPRWDPAQWRWGLQFLSQCTDAAFERNVAQIVALGRFSHAAHRALVAETGIEFNRLERGILHFFSSEKEFQAGAQGAALMRKHGVDRQVLSPEALLQVEPALRSAAHLIHGGTYTPTDESGDARVFTQALAERAAQAGVVFRYHTDIDRFELHGRRASGVWVRDRLTQRGERLQADAYVVALGSFSAPLMAKAGVRLPIYPAKGYSVTMRVRHPEQAATVSLIDDARKVAISRLGDHVRVAGTAEMAGYDQGLDSHTAQVRCQALVDRYEALFPGVADRTGAEFFTGLRPSTPDNIPLIGRSALEGVWLNTGHGTLGWTHGAGSGLALAQLMSGEPCGLHGFRFCT